MKTTQIVEALLFASDAPLTAADIARADESLDEDMVEAAIQELRVEYDRTERAVQIFEIAGGYQLLTRPEYAPYLERFGTVPQSGRLSGAALEVLAIIAYRQPIGRAEIEEIRGVGSSGVLRTLQDRGLIDVVGRSEALGRPLLYGTTARFLEHFGFRSLEDLPRPDELPVVLRGGGDTAQPTGAPPATPSAAAPSTVIAGATGNGSTTPPDGSRPAPTAAGEQDVGADG
jgi:segregation and condensation protein B